MKSVLLEEQTDKKAFLVGKGEELGSMP